MVIRRPYEHDDQVDRWSASDVGEKLWRLFNTRIQQFRLSVLNKFTEEKRFVKLAILYGNEIDVMNKG